MNFTTNLEWNWRLRLLHLLLINVIMLYVHLHCITSPFPPLVCHLFHPITHNVLSAFLFSLRPTYPSWVLPTLFIYCTRIHDQLKRLREERSLSVHDVRVLCIAVILIVAQTDWIDIRDGPESLRIASHCLPLSIVALYAEFVSQANHLVRSCCNNTISF